MKKQVLQSVCDRCHVESVVDWMPARSGVFLPKGWMNVTGRTSTAEVFSMDLCPECIQPVLSKAGKYDALNPKSRLVHVSR